MKLLMKPAPKSQFYRHFSHGSVCTLNKVHVGQGFVLCLYQSQDFLVFDF